MEANYQNLRNCINIGSIILVLIICSQALAQQNPDPYRKTKNIKEAFTPMPLGSITPTGWLKDNLRKNLNGFTGHLDSLAPDLIIVDDIYGKDRLSKNIKHKNVGALSSSGDLQSQILWWNSETQSNWFDGLIRTSVLLRDEKNLLRCENLVKKIFSTQDDDGYLGIYNKDLRYQFNSENGELWSKATLYRALLGWYEYKNDKILLGRIEKAVSNVMSNYPINQSHPFHSTSPYSYGITHGLAFTDVLENLYAITNKTLYLDYALFLYKDFSEQILEDDAQYQKLTDLSIPLKGHGVHTYEHLRSVAAAYYASANPELKKALDNFLVKIDKTITPSGAPAGDEFIFGRTGDATQTGYEYCSLHELMVGWTDLFMKTARTEYADKAEHIFFNAAMGASHPTESAICYLKTDNSFYLTGGKNGDTTDRHQTRYRYSPVHKEAAVCCVPNAGRIGPYYIQNMWVKSGDGVVASVLGPCELTTTINGKSVTIKEVTQYPFLDNLRFDIVLDKPLSFTIRVRRPAWATSVKSTAGYKEENGFIVFNNKWKNGDSFTINFGGKFEIKQTATKEIYFQSGPLVLCRPIPGTQHITKTYSVDGLSESTYVPDDIVRYNYKAGYEILRLDTIPNKYETSMFNPTSQTDELIDLVPMSYSILRQVTFKNVTTATDK